MSTTKYIWKHVHLDGRSEMLAYVHDDLCDGKDGFFFSSLVVMWKYLYFSGRTDSMLVWYII